MNISADEEIIQELFDSLIDLSDEADECLAILKTESSDELLHRLFRAIHTIKGNAALVSLESVVSFTHSLEEVAGSLRAHRYSSSPAICEIIQVSLEIIRGLHQRDLFEVDVGELHEHKINDMLIELSQCDESNLHQVTLSILAFMGFDDLETVPVIKAEIDKSQQAIQIILNDEKYFTDLNFFHELALLQDGQSHYWSGRSIQIFEWAMKTNSVAGNIVPYEQFAAAIYLHDIGMTFLPNEVRSKSSNYSEHERALVQQHPKWGYEFLSRIPGWQEASNIILDHHERVDGKDYPNGKKSGDIHPGAKIFAIIDAFFSITRGRADRKQRQSVIRALMEINKNINTQFDAYLFQCFNSMIRQSLNDGLL